MQISTVSDHPLEPWNPKSFPSTRDNNNRRSKVKAIATHRDGRVLKTATFIRNATMGFNCEKCGEGWRKNISNNFSQRMTHTRPYQWVPLVPPMTIEITVARFARRNTGYKKEDPLFFFFSRPNQYDSLYLHGLPAL